MHIVLQSPTVRTPLRAFWSWLTEAPLPLSTSRVGQRSTPCKVMGQMPPVTTLRNQVLASQPNVPAMRNTHRPLRTVRVMDANQAPGQVGRMVMSGRMADVCAELDRLVACEARLH
jgi:hypothetical protein